MEIKSLKLSYMILAVMFLLLILTNSIFYKLEKNLEESLTTATSLNKQLKETEKNLEKILTVSKLAKNKDINSAKEDVLAFVDSLSEKYSNVEVNEGLKIDEQNQLVSMMIKIKYDSVNRKQLENILSLSENESPFFIIKSLDISFSTGKGYSLELGGEVKDGFIKDRKN